MGNLSVQMRLHGIVIDDRTLPVRRSVVVGDWPQAKAVFPGSPVCVRRVGNCLDVNGTLLREGESVDLCEGAVEVTLSHTALRWTRIGSGVMDQRFLAAVVVLVASGHWIEAANGWIKTQPWTTEAEHVLNVVGVDAVGTSRGGKPRPAAIRAQAEERAAMDWHATTDGPLHLNDDAVTGVGYHRWFKRIVPTDPNAFQADARLEADPDDVEARRIIGRAAYNAGHTRLAAWHYMEVLSRYPGDDHARLRLAWAERRAGHHTRESELYREVLVGQPEHPLALGGLSMAAARLGRMDEAQNIIDQLHVVAPAHPYTDLTSAVVEALRGDERDAVRSLRRVIERRDLLDEELQVELRRDVATDPAFSGLRTQWRLRAMLRRHLGAASPQGIR